MTDSIDTIVTDQQVDNLSEITPTPAKKRVNGANTENRKLPKQAAVHHIDDDELDDKEKKDKAKKIKSVADAIDALLNSLPKSYRAEAYVKAGHKQAKAQGINAKLPDTLVAQQLKEIDPDIKNISRDQDSTNIWRYNHTAKVWEVIPSIEIPAFFTNKIAKNAINGANNSKISSITKTVINLSKPRPKRREGLIAFNNGMYDPSKKKLIPHSAEYGVETVIPCDYDPKRKEAPVFHAWMDKISNKDDTRRKLLEALLYATITGRYEMQTFWELVGKGGAGKSTFAKLLTLITGEEKTASLKLAAVDGNEKNRFALFPAVYKKLIIYHETAKIAGGFENLKGMTGGDPMPVEDKHEKAFSHIFKAVHVVLANDPLISTETGSGVFRRRITIYFEAATKIEDQDTRFIDRLKPELPAIINYLMESITEEKFKEIIKDAERGQDKLNAMARTDSIYGWGTDGLVITKNPNDFVGMGNKSGWQKESLYGKHLRATNQLYPNYLMYCEAYGVKEKSLKEFIEALTSLFTDKMGHQEKEVSYKRDREDGKDRTGYTGITINEEADYIRQLKEACERSPYPEPIDPNIKPNDKEQKPEPYPQ